MRETPVHNCEIVYCDVCMSSGFDTEPKLKATGWTFRQFGDAKPRLILCAECEAEYAERAKTRKAAS